MGMSWHACAEDARAELQKMGESQVVFGGSAAARMR